MQVSLKVVGGKNDGRLIAINVPEFVIGRGETAHLRPQSDLVSRAHCSVLVADGKVVLRDLGSRNGTFLNDERLEGEQQVTIGDRFRVGRLQLEFQIDPAVAGSKQPKVEAVPARILMTRVSRIGYLRTLIRKRWRGRPDPRHDSLCSMRQSVCC